MKGENLRTFISIWDTHPPDPSALETLFCEQVKNVRAIQHDIEVYNRAEEGTENHSYKFLVEAVQRYLRRERLKSNRDRIPPVRQQELSVCQVFSHFLSLNLIINIIRTVDSEHCPSGPWFVNRMLSRERQLS